MKKIAAVIFSCMTLAAFTFQASAQSLLFEVGTVSAADTTNHTEEEIYKEVVESAKREVEAKKGQQASTTPSVSPNFGNVTFTEGSLLNWFANRN